MDVTKYRAIAFSVRAKEEGNPGVVKLVITNHKNETSSYYVMGIDPKWQEWEIPLEDFQQITDWTNVKDVSFVLESWNVNKRKGIILVDDIHFSS